MSRDIFLRPLVAADAFVHSAPNPKQRSYSEIDRLGSRAKVARLRIPIPSGFMPVIVTTRWLLKTDKRGGCQFGNHGPIRDSWPIAFWGCPRGHRVITEARCRSTRSLYFRRILSLEPERLQKSDDITRQDPGSGKRTLYRDVQTDTCRFSCWASKHTPFFQTSKVMVAILRAKVRRAIVGFIPVVSKPL
jgi:hypothetical protein